MINTADARGDGYDDLNTLIDWAVPFTETFPATETPDSRHHDHQGGHASQDVKMVLSAPACHPLTGDISQPSLQHSADRMFSAAESELDDNGDEMTFGMLTAASQDSLMADDCGDDSTSKKDHPFTRVNHSEIEKRRRDKMNLFIIELSSMVPMCAAMNRKLDKLTVLRMVVQHMKTLKGSAIPYTEVHNKPAFLSEAELKHLMLKAAEGFLFVVSCDRGRILYVSQSVKDILNIKQPDLLGQSLFDFIHPKDMCKVKEQLLAGSDMSPRERYIDAKTMMPVKTEMPQKSSTLCSGARRSFFCRMKMGSGSPMDTSSPAPKASKGQKRDLSNQQCHKKTEKKSFSVIQCTGYIKSWPRAKVGIEDDQDGSETESCDLSCLVAVGLPICQNVGSQQGEASKVPAQPVDYISRHSCDGKFTSVDQRVISALGYVPQELIGTSIYEYCHSNDVNTLHKTHGKVLQTLEKLELPPLRFKSKDGSYVLLRVTMEPFVNPWTKDTEQMILRNTTVLPPEVSSSRDIPDIRVQEDTPMDMKPNISSERLGRSLKLSRMGEQLVDEILNEFSGGSNSAMALECTSSSYQPLSKAPQSNSSFMLTKEGNLDGVLLSRNLWSPNSDPEEPATTPTPPTLNDYNLSESATSTSDSDEAGMAIVMSLLEADGGLGGPIDLNDFSWPL